MAGFMASLLFLVEATAVRVRVNKVFYIILLGLSFADLLEKRNRNEVKRWSCVLQVHYTPC